MPRYVTRQLTVLSVPAAVPFRLRLEPRGFPEEGRHPVSVQGEQVPPVHILRALQRPAGETDIGQGQGVGPVLDNPPRVPLLGGEEGTQQGDQQDSQGEDLLHRLSPSVRRTGSLGRHFSLFGSVRGFAESRKARSFVVLSCFTAFNFVNTSKKGLTYLVCQSSSPLVLMFSAPLPRGSV